MESSHPIFSCFGWQIRQDGVTFPEEYSPTCRTNSSHKIGGTQPSHLEYDNDNRPKVLKVGWSHPIPKNWDGVTPYLKIKMEPFHPNLLSNETSQWRSPYDVHDNLVKFLNTIIIPVAEQQESASPRHLVCHVQALKHIRNIIPRQEIAGGRGLLAYGASSLGTCHR